MDFLDLYYRAVKDFYDTTTADRNNVKTLKSIAQAGADKDYLEVTRTRCIIEDDWIIAIEKGLPFVKKAIDEERQFIANEGNVVPIEKVRKVSKASTVHLAKHSNLITHLPENGNENIVPDKLFMEEKLSEFAVYENRFLFLLLVTLRDFVNVRAEKIEESGSAYYSDFRIDKNVRFKKRYIGCEIKFHEQNLDYSETLSDEKTKILINRIEDIQHLIISYLSTPLMETVAKVAMIKPPIIKTNVLKMDINFKNSVELYDYISQYKKDGYKIEEIKTVVKPFTEDLALLAGNIVNTASYLSYAYYGDVQNQLKENYLREEEKRRAEKEESVRKEIDRLRNLKQKDATTMEEYVYLLEKRNEKLQRDSDALKNALDDKKQLLESVNTLNAKNSALQEYNEQLKSENKETRKNMEQTIEACEEKLRQAQLRYEEKEKGILQANETLLNETNLLKARIKGNLIRQGEPVDDSIDYSEKEEFLQLEKEYYAFISFFEKKWKDVKRKIKVNYLGKKLIKAEQTAQGKNGNEK